MVGRSATFSLDCSASFDPDDPQPLPADAFGWTCTEVASGAACSISAPIGPVWSVDADDLSADARYRFELTVARDNRSATSSQVVEVSTGSPPDVSILAGDIALKANPTSKLVLYGTAIPSFVGEMLELTWTAVTSASNVDADAAFDLTQPGMLSTSVHGANLVVRAGQLRSGAHYTFLLTAVGRDAVGYSQIDLVMNSAPCCGQVVVTPTNGSAVLDPFSISAQGWRDDDTPLQYRFSTTLDFDQSSVAPLVDFSPERFTTATLPAGAATDGYRRVLLVEVRDVFGASASARTMVHVQPFTPPVGTSVQDTATALLSTGLATGDTAAVGQLVLAMCGALNDNSTSQVSAEDAAGARDVLLDALISTTDVLTRSVVSRSTAIMLAVTAAPEQLSSDATDKGLAFAKQLSATGGQLSSNAIESIASTVSNLLDASTLQFKDAGGYGGGHGRRLTEADASDRSDMMTAIITDCASAITTSHIVGEEEQTVGSDRLKISVQTNTADGWAGSQIGNGLVAVPPGAFDDQDSQTAEPIASTVVSYADTGPLFWAPEAPSNDSIRGSGITSVTFARDGSEIAVHNLATPFIVQLTVDPSQSVPARGVPECGHWNITTNDWVVDGILLGRSSDHTKIVCSYTHLTDFASFIGGAPNTNEISIVKIFSAEWLANPAGAIVSLTVILKYTIHHC